MLDALDFVRRSLGYSSDAASATGSAIAKAGELLARFTTTVAGRIDAALSTIPSASDYTSARAAKLDHIGVKSIQQVTIAMSGEVTSVDATITSVDTTRSAVRFQHFKVQTNSTAADGLWKPRVKLQSATAVRAESQTSGGSMTRDVGAVVVEYN